MSYTYTFKVNKVDTYKEANGLNDVIFKVFWEYVIEDENGNKASSFGWRPLSEPVSNEFRPFSEITKEEMISWIMPSFNIEGMQTALQKELAKSLEPEIVRVDYSSDDRERTYESTPDVNV